MDGWIQEGVEPFHVAAFFVLYWDDGRSQLSMSAIS